MRQLHIVIFALLFPLVHSPLSSFQTNSFQVDIDVAQFLYKQETNYLELYYAFYESQLTYVEKEGQFEGGILMHTIIRLVDDGSVILDRVWQIPHAVPNTNELSDQNSIIGVIGMAIPKEDCTLDVECFDEQNSSRRHRVSHNLPERLFQSGRIAASDVELCSSLPKMSKQTQSIFYKNTLEVFPNPDKIYGFGAPSLYYYVETYNLLASSKEGVYQNIVSICDLAGKELITRKQIKPRVNESSVEIGSLDVSSLPEGSYQFRFSIVDSVTNLTVTSTKDFFIQQPGSFVTEFAPPELAEVLASEYGSMSEEDLDSEFERGTYIATDSEKFQYRSITSVEAKRQFLYDFWKRRDPNLQTFKNEVKWEYIRRVEYSNEHFRTGRSEGWKTDRGRIFILYGPPDEYERHDSEMAAKPYELWHYHEIQGGVHFVFADLFGFRDYILLHSTHRDELRDDNWRIQVQQ